MEKILEKLEKYKQNANRNNRGIRQETVVATGDNRHRMTEQEENEELMNAANDIDSNLITRFEASPWCKLKIHLPYFFFLFTKTFIKILFCTLKI
jgi:hypothetical protein